MALQQPLEVGEREARGGINLEADGGIWRGEPLCGVAADAAKDGRPYARAEHLGMLWPGGDATDGGDGEVGALKCLGSD